MFKIHWEKTSTSHPLAHNLIERMVHLACPGQKLISHQLIEGGCANLNIKINLEGVENPFILRVYLWDKEAAFREKNLSILLKNTLPLPTFYFIGNIDHYTFALTEFIRGIPLRDLLLSDLPHDRGAIMFDIGVLLSQIHKNTFPTAGFFDKNLAIIPPKNSDDLSTFARECLDKNNVLAVLDQQTILSIKTCLNTFGHLFPDKNENCLVHGDFDPANILVDQTDHTWKVKGILDWEFSFSGSPLWDVANMLRYSAQMPPDFEDSFIRGLTCNGKSLPENWHSTIHLLNLVSLLDILRKENHKPFPHRCEDIHRLINNIIEKLSQTQIS